MHATMQTGWVGWTSTPSMWVTLGFWMIQSKLRCVIQNAKCIFNFHFILCLVYTVHCVRPLDNFITCLNIYNYEHFGRKGFERIFICLCDTNTPYNSLTLTPQCTAIAYSYMYILRIAIQLTSVGLAHTRPNNLLPRQHHCTREIWATFLDVAYVTGYIKAHDIHVFTLVHREGNTQGFPCINQPPTHFLENKCWQSGLVWGGGIPWDFPHKCLPTEWVLYVLPWFLAV